MELISDNHGAFTSNESKDFLGLVCRHYRTIKEGNSQANYAETQFRLFKKRFRRMMNWMGSSWDAKSIESQNNEDYTNIEDFPTYEEAIAQLKAKINEWNEGKTHVGLTRSEMYAENLHPDCKLIDERIWRKLTGRYSSKEITRQRGTIQLERKGEIYKFDIPDFEVLGELVREYLGYASLVQTDIYWDDECADVYTKDGRYMFSCYPTPKAAISHAEATDESMAAIGKGMIRKVKFRIRLKTSQKKLEPLPKPSTTNIQNATETFADRPSMPKSVLMASGKRLWKQRLNRTHGKLVKSLHPFLPTLAAIRTHT